MRQNRFRCGSLFLSIAMMSSSQAVKFDKTVGGSQEDANTFGGMGKAELDELEKAAAGDKDLDAINKSIKKFQSGRDSSGADTPGSGRYSNFGEMHMESVDSMVSHDGASNGLENAVEVAALGQGGLVGEARIKEEQKRMREFCKPVDENDVTKGCINSQTGQLQAGDHSISAALYDAGAAHGADHQPVIGADGRPTGRFKDDPHRVYMVKKEVRDAAEKLGQGYADRLKADATLAPGKKSNLDLLHSEYSWLEQVKAQNLKADAFALRAARLAGVDTSNSQQRKKIDEFKQLALDTFADKRFAQGSGGPDMKAAQAEIENKLAERISKQKVLNGETICSNGEYLADCSQVDANAPGFEKNTSGLDLAAKRILNIIGVDPSETAKLAQVKEKLVRGGFFPDPQAPAPPPTTGTIPMVNLASLTRSLTFDDLSGIAPQSKLAQLYSDAEAKMRPERRQLMEKYKTRLNQNKCLSFGEFCMASVPSAGIRPTDDMARADTELGGEFQKVSGDPGAFYHDTRELIYNRFSIAYDAPLDQFETIVNNADFNSSIDRLAKGNKPLYAEFQTMLKNAKEAAAKVQKVDEVYLESLRSGGATPAQLALIKKNYSDKKNFDPKTMNVMQLFGQNKERDAVVMEWRKKGAKNVIPAKKNVGEPVAQQESPVRPVARPDFSGAGGKPFNSAPNVNNAAPLVQNGLPRL